MFIIRTVPSGHKVSEIGSSHTVYREDLCNPCMGSTRPEKVVRVGKWLE